MVLQELDSVLKVSCRRITHEMNIAEISHLHAWSNYTFIHHNEKKVLSAKTLRFYHMQLDNDLFIRPHQSYSVNINHISHVNFRTSTIFLKSGIEIPISRARKKVVKEFFSYRSQADKEPVIN